MPLWGWLVVFVASLYHYRVPIFYNECCNGDNRVVLVRSSCLDADMDKAINGACFEDIMWCNWYGECPPPQRCGQRFCLSANQCEVDANCVKGKCNSSWTQPIGFC